MLELRQYQTQSIESLRDGFRDGHKRQVLAASTGAGKSVIALSILNAAQQKGSRVLFVCDRRVLVDQFSKHLDGHGIDHGVFMAKHWRYRPDCRVQVASIQTLEKMEAWPSVDLIIVDEIHAVMRASLKTFLTNRPDVKVIGLTATPFHPELGNHFTSITNVITMRELVDDGHLVPFRVFVATEINTEGLKVTAGEWQKDELEKRGLQVVGDVVADYVRITNQVFGGPRKTICFSSGVAHGEELVRRFAEVGLNFVQISYRDTDEYKTEVLQEFGKPDTCIHGVISSDILSRGFDQTDVEHVILARPLRKSFSMHVQMVGRGARPHDGKEFCCIQDNAGNWLRFLDSWDQLYSEGVDTLRSEEDQKKRKEPTEREKKAAKCPACGYAWSASDICPACGFKRIRQNTVSEVPGEMLELGKSDSKKIPISVKEDFYRGLLGYCKNKGYKDGFAYHKYIEKFGVGPANTFDKTPIEPSADVIGFIKHLAIKRQHSARA